MTENFIRTEKTDEIIRSADHNLAAEIRRRMQHAPRGRIFERDGILMFSIGHPAAEGFLNGVLPVNSEAAPEGLLKSARSFFGSSTNMATFWVREQFDDALETVLRSSGLKPLREPGMPCMALTRRLASNPLPENLTLSRVTQAEDAANFAQVVMAAFGLSLRLAQDVFQVPALSTPNVAAFVARRKKRPVAAAMVIHTDTVAGIYYVGTIPEARGQGLGELCTRIAAEAGFEMGADAIILQASAAGEPLYKRMGFQTLTHYKWYRFPQNAA